MENKNYKGKTITTNNNIILKIFTRSVNKDLKAWATPTQYAII